MAFSSTARFGSTSLWGFRSGVLSPVCSNGTQRACQQIQRRFLGNEVRGPDFDPLSPNTWHTDIKERLIGVFALFKLFLLPEVALSLQLRPHMGVLCRSLTRPALSYNEFKQFCESLRLVLFAGGSALVAADMLFFHPTRSSYWLIFSPLKWPGLLLSPFRGPKGPHGVFDFEEAGLTRGPDGTVKTAAYTAFEKTMT